MPNKIWWHNNNDIITSTNTNKIAANGTGRSARSTTIWKKRFFENIVYVDAFYVSIENN